jgi:hypothetical protein
LWWLPSGGVFRAAMPLALEQRGDTHRSVKLEPIAAFFLEQGH